ncbi:SDR family oxidoreductase [Pseudaminobacter soli (ex Li et al. 2025)]|uniref:Oxidoreductase n=1 Tax=Pseudaminobacter soli (ex Li et al. 2025) TaxID=1295366 RepID=A0A2P7S9L1_9HYPH|nr:oxidoreductase [Mesorhizobium soli]
MLITGAGRGLGRELARQYLQLGWHVIACSRTQPSDGNEEGMEIQPLDVADPASISDLGARLAGRPLDVLINNAGVRSRVAGLDRFEPDEFLDVLATNTLGPVLMARAVRANLRLGRNRVVANIGSRAGSMAEGLLDDDDDDYAYRCSKAALNMATVQLAHDLETDSITVLSLHPGWVRTDMGGEEAILPIEDSARALRAIIAAAKPECSGSFRAFDGRQVAW